MIKPILDYAATVWSPHTQKDISTIERSQRQAARFVFCLQCFTNAQLAITCSLQTGTKGNYDI